MQLTEDQNPQPSFREASRSENRSELPIDEPEVLRAPSRKDHTMTTLEVVTRFGELGVPRSKRSIEMYCKGGKLDALFDEDEKRYYIAPGSVETLVAQIKEINGRHGQFGSPPPMKEGAAETGSAQTEGTSEKEGGGLGRELGKLEGKLEEKDERIAELKESITTLNAERLKDKEFISGVLQYTGRLEGEVVANSGMKRLQELMPATYKAITEKAGDLVRRMMGPEHVDSVEDVGSGYARPIEESGSSLGEGMVEDEEAES